jgi:ERF superfamily
MKSFIDSRQNTLCVVVEGVLPEFRDAGVHRSWYPIHSTTNAESELLTGRLVIETDHCEGIYVDEEGNVYQLMDKGATKPIAVEGIGETGKTELETLLEASLGGPKNGEPKQLFRKNRRGNRKQQELRAIAVAPEAKDAPGPAPVEPGPPTLSDTLAESPVPLNLRQKLAEVRRRIGYIQKRGHNERFNYSYVTAADIAGSVGDLLSELGVVVIPSLENITYESTTGRNETTRMARVVMAYTFSDVDSGEELVAKVAGQGLDTGDKAPYKAMTGALKYALLQSFLLATGDDPEDERMDGRITPPGSDRPVTPEEIHELERLINDTGTDLERVLAYYKVAALGEMTETAYQRAVEVLRRKPGSRRQQETVHAPD